MFLSFWPALAIIDIIRIILEELIRGDLIFTLQILVVPINKMRLEEPWMLNDEAVDQRVETKDSYALSRFSSDTDNHRAVWPYLKRNFS